MELHDNWWEEERSAYLYEVLAKYETNLLHKKLFLDLQKTAMKQAQLWHEKLIKAGVTRVVFKPDYRTRLVSLLVKYLGTEMIHPILSAMKIRGMSIFTQYHSEHKHKSLNAVSNLRAAIFGVNDGLISNISLLLGIEGANANPHFILIAGITGLLAGACSMAAGEYISVRSQREVFEYQIAIEKEELALYPEEEREELSLIYEARGLKKTEADHLAKLMIENPETGLNALVREELGLNPEELVSPVGAMLSSFFSFALGAAIPLIPYLVKLTEHCVLVSISLTALSLFAIGALISLYTNKNAWWSGIRMLLIGAISGSITFFIGKWYSGSN